MSDVFYREYLAACAERDAARADLAAARADDRPIRDTQSDIDEIARLRAELAAARAEIEEADNLLDICNVPFHDENGVEYETLSQRLRARIRVEKGDASE